MGETSRRSTVTMGDHGSSTSSTIDDCDEETPLLSQIANSSSNELVIIKKARCLALEPVAVAVCFGWSMAGIVLANQIILQTCVYLGYDENLCLLLGTNDNSSEVAELETAVQPTAARITMVNSILISVLPALCGLFLGPWSDRFGRKPLMIIPCIGFVITYATIAILCQISTTYPLSPWLYIVAHIPAAISGGASVVCTGFFSSTADATSEANRTIRMGILQACILLGAFLGMISSSFILEWTSASTVFLISAGAMLFTINYVYFFIADSVTQESGNASAGNCNKFREIFRFDSLRELFNTFFKARSGYDRGIVCLTVVIGSITGLGSGGTNVIYLFTRKKFNWSLEDFTLWQSADCLSTIAGSFIGIVTLKKLFKLPDIAIAFLSVLCSTSDSLIKGLASHGWQLYMATGVTPLKGTDGAALMAVASSILPSHDIAKIFSMGMSVTAIIPLAAAPLFTYIYNDTLTTAPETYNFVASGIFSVNLLFVGIIHVLLKKRQYHHSVYGDPARANEDVDQLVP